MGDNILRAVFLVFDVCNSYALIPQPSLVVFLDGCSNEVAQSDCNPVQHCPFYND